MPWMRLWSCDLSLPITFVEEDDYVVLFDCSSKEMSHGSVNGKCWSLVYKRLYDPLLGIPNPLGVQLA